MPETDPRMEPPQSGIKVRMYRQGHGDCFLLAMRKRDGEPFYLLIDCGLKNNSEIKISARKKVEIDQVVQDIGAATNNHIDVALITHEHQDHVNGFAKKDGNGKLLWDPIEFDWVWLAWTEDPNDDDAKRLRERFGDTLLGLSLASSKIANNPAAAKSSSLELVRELIATETGEDDFEKLVTSKLRSKSARGLGFSEFASLAIKGITNKRAMKYVRDKAQRGHLFLNPDAGPYYLPQVDGVNVYALGPPKNVELLLSLDPKGKEEFKLSPLDRQTASFFSAVSEGKLGDTANPFGRRFSKTARSPEMKKFLQKLGYSSKGNEWCQIDGNWLETTESLALRLNNEVNNTSLVIAIELPETGKVLIFTGDAQRGNWISWSDLKWRLGQKTVSSRDLLGRTVFYKAGHHGSHNATLNGTVEDDWANLSWMAQGAYQNDFVVMIPANSKWAYGKSKPWKHPLEAIEDALHAKAFGRVFQTDVLNVPQPQTNVINNTRWNQFKGK